ncbi:energy transducer TonB [Variovorax sp. RCC_210]|uniref:energy transducer TonB n=1 Tax=Variovorax sp. RCC_210 TaxID=3239217 RepID=UPI003523AE5E
MQGKVVARVMVTSTGTVSDVQLAHSSGFAELDQSVLEAGKCQRYEPGTVAGVPSEMWTEFPVTFILKK